MIISVWSLECEKTYHEQIVDLEIPPKTSHIMEQQFARTKELMLFHRSECIRKMHHARLQCVNIQPLAKAALSSVLGDQSALQVIGDEPGASAGDQSDYAMRVWGTAEEKAIYALSSRGAAHSYREGLRSRGAADGFGRGVDCNGLGPLFCATAVEVDLYSAAATAAGRDAAAHASTRELCALQLELAAACNRATAAACSSVNPTSAADAILKATGSYVRECEYVRGVAMRVLRDDEDGMPVGQSVPAVSGFRPVLGEVAVLGDA